MIRAGRFVLPPGGIFSPVHIDNLVDGIALAAAKPEGAGQVFTITDGAGVPNEEFFGHYFRMLGRSGPRTLPRRALTAVSWGVDRATRALGQENEMNPGAVHYLARSGTYSIEKARRVLGYEPRVGLEEGMRRTEAWLREQGMLDT
jgi:nucleoside-diphosphate-sugar epimerase